MTSLSSLIAGRRTAWATAVVAASLATMVKQPAVHIVVALAVAWRVAPVDARRRVPGWLLPLLPLVCCQAWYAWAQWLGEHYVGHFAVGGGSGLINPGLWLSGDVNFYARFAVATIVLLGGVTGLPVALLGLGRPQRPFDRVLLAWLAGAVAIVLVANGAAITHYYYLLPTMAALAVWVGRGAARFEWFMLRWAVTLLVLCGPLLVLPFPELGRWYGPAERSGGRPGGARTDAARRLRLHHCYGTQLLYEADRRGDFLLPEAGFWSPGMSRRRPRGCSGTSLQGEATCWRPRPARRCGRGWRTSR